MKVKLQELNAFGVSPLLERYFRSVNPLNRSQILRASELIPYQHIINYNLQESLALQNEIVKEYHKSQEHIHQELIAVEKAFEKQLDNIEMQEALAMEIKKLDELQKLVHQLYFMKAERDRNKSTKPVLSIDVLDTKSFLELEEKGMKPAQQILDPIDWSLLESVKGVVAEAEREGQMDISKLKKKFGTTKLDEYVGATVPPQVQGTDS